MNNTIEILNHLLEEVLKRLENNKASNITFDETLEKSLDNYRSNIFAILDILDKIDKSAFKPETLKGLDEITKILNAFKDNTSFPLSKDIELNIRKNDVVSSTINTLRQELAKQKEFTKLSERKDRIQSLIDRLNSLKENEYFEDIEDLISLLLDESNLDVTARIKVFDEINIHNIEASKAKSEELKIKQTRTKEYQLTIEQLNEIFAKYNYNLDLVDKDIIEKLLINGNVENIDKVFAFYESIGLRFKENEKESERYLILLYKTNEENISRLKEICKKYDYSIKELLSKAESPFISNSDGTIIKGEGDSSIQVDYVGAHDDFLANIDYLESIGYDIKTALKKSSSTLSFSNRQIRENVKAYKLYGIDIEKYNGTFRLSGLKTYNPLFTIDQFIELGELPYLFTNTSACGFYYPNCIQFYRIYKAQKEGTEYKEANKNRAGYHYLSKINQVKEGNSFLSSDSDRRKETGTIEVKIFDDQTNAMIEEIISNSQSFYNPSIKDNEIVKLLDEKFGVPSDLKVYNVEGKTYSRLKVLRLLSMLENRIDLDKSELALFCLTYNTIMTEEELEIARNSIIELTKGLN